MKSIFKVEPADPSTISVSGHDGTSQQLWILFILCIIGEFILILINLIFGGSWWLYGVLISIAAYFLARGASYAEYESTYDERKKIAIQQAEYSSQHLNNILDKSKEIIKEMLPYFESSAINNLKIANVDFKENALYPFWERIEEICNNLGCFKEAVDQLVVNGEIYSNVLVGKKHNFPTPFPIGTDISISQNVLDEFYSIVREAHKKPDFANIYGHYKTHKILIAGFQTLAEAINNMKDAILSSINDLRHSIKSDFRELKHIQIEQLNSFETSQSTMNNMLSSMDRKLYYMQYHKRPTSPFHRPLND